MSRYFKIMVMITLLILAIAGVGFKSSIDYTAEVLQKSLDTQTKSDASLIALSLNGVDIESDIELVESLIRGAYALGSFEEVTLYGRPSGDSQNLKMQNKKDMGENAHRNSFFELQSSQALADITLDGEIQGKVLVKTDVGPAFTDMEKAVDKMLKLFLILAFGSIIILGVVVKIVLRVAKNN